MFNHLHHEASAGARTLGSEKIKTEKRLHASFNPTLLGSFHMHAVASLNNQTH